MRKVCFILLVAVVATASAFAQAPQASKNPSPPDEEITRIVGQSMKSSGAMEFLEALTDTIGGRITGSPGSREAAELILKTLKEAGFENAHIEEYKLTSVWHHGITSGEVVAPVERALVIGSYGWV